MGDHEGWAQPNGLLPGEGANVTRGLDPERWVKAEERTAQLIARIQPSRPSEERRYAVAEYVKRLVHNCLNCQVFTFGSVPLKTYLPDGDIDLTAFSKHQTLKDTWANEVRDVLESEEKSENAEFRVKEVQYIQAEVKIIKCLVENIVVDISFNQLGGLCTLCFLEEVDHLIGQNHLFKRSIILVKAWCYYESRILGAHHGLISTYALETLVLYIFHVFNKSFSGPLEVLYRFLTFFSNFDWDNYCVSLWGPIPLSSLPDMAAERPRKDGGELLLDKGSFLQNCHAVYGVYPAGQENQGQSFLSKHFNVVDPLRTSNNLGRSVSKGNFFRIRSAFGFGARKLARILECPKDSIMSEIDQFFMNTWERHGSGQRPDAPSPDFWHRQPSRSDVVDNSQNNRILGTFNNDDDENTEKHGEQVQAITDHFISLNLQGDGVKHDQWISGLPTRLVAQSAEFNNLNSSIDQEPLIKKGGVSSVLKTASPSEVWKSMTNRYHDQQPISDQSSKYVNREKNQKGSKADSEENVVYHFARPRSSPELSSVPNEMSTRGRRNRGEITDSGRSQFASARVDHGSIDRRGKNMSSDSSCSYASKTATVTESLDLRRSLSQENVDTGNFNEILNYPNYFSSTNVFQDADLDVQGEEVTRPETVDTSVPTHQNVRDPVNLIGIPRPPFVNRQPPQLHLPMNFTPVQLPVPISPSVLASMAYAPANLSGMVHTGLPTEPSWVPGGQSTSYSSLQFPQSAVRPPLPPYVPNIGMGTHANPEDMGTSDKLTVSGSHHEEEVHYDPSFWRKMEEHDPQLGHARLLEMKSARVFHSTPSESEAANHEIPASPVVPRGPSPGLLNGQNKFVNDVKGLSQEEKTNFTSHYNLPRFTDDSGLETDEKAVTTSSQEISSSRMAESTWTGATGRATKFTKDKRSKVRGNNNAEFQNPKPRETFSSSYGKSNNGWQAERAINSMHVGEDTVHLDTQSFGAANAGSLNHGDCYSSSLHGSRLAIQPAVSESNLPVMAARNVGPISPILPHVQPSTMPGYDSRSAVSCDSVIPGARHRQMDNAGLLPFTFYPTGPPFPFLTMLPLYNIPSEGVSSGESTALLDSIGPSDDSCDNCMDQSEHCVDTSSSYDLGECSEHSDVFTSSSMGAVEGSSMEHRDDPKSDILQSDDFISHFRNLQYGRFCQNSRIHGPLLYPSPMLLPPMYLQGHFPWDGPGRPLSPNLNVLTQFVNYGPKFVPVSSLQPNSNRPGGNLQRFNAPNQLFGEEFPRYRGGTGTYLPHPRQVPSRDRQSSGNRGNRGSYGQERNDHGDRDAGWVFIPKNRGGAGRGQNKSDARNQNEKSNSRMDRNSEGKGGDRVWDSRNENFRRSSYQAQQTSFASGNSSVNTGNFMPHGSGGLMYGMYPYANGSVPAIAGNGPAVPSVVMLYPYDHNLGFTPEALEFGSLGPLQFGGTQHGQFNDSAARLNDGRFYERRHNSYQANSSPEHSPADQPSSPKQHQRSSTQHSYELKDEDFPPLSFRNQSGRAGSNNFNSGSTSNRSSHYQAFLVTPSS